MCAGVYSTVPPLASCVLVMHVCLCLFDCASRHEHVHVLANVRVPAHVRVLALVRVLCCACFGALKLMARR